MNCLINFSPRFIFNFFCFTVAMMQGMMMIASQGHDGSVIDLECKERNPLTGYKLKTHNNIITGIQFLCRGDEWLDAMQSDDGEWQGKMKCDRKYIIQVFMRRNPDIYRFTQISADCKEGPSIRGSPMEYATGHLQNGACPGGAYPCGVKFATVVKSAQGTTGGLGRLAMGCCRGSPPPWSPPGLSSTCYFSTWTNSR